MVWFSGTIERDGFFKEVVSILSMFAYEPGIPHKSFLSEEIEFQSREAAFDYIENVPVSMLIAFLKRNDEEPK